MQTPMTSTAMLGLALPAVLFAAVYFPTITQLSIALVSPYAKADVRKRLFAATIDGIPVIITWLLYGDSGAPLLLVIGAGYLLLRDSMRGQSLGKLLLGLVVISLETGRPCTVKGSVWRNIVFLIPGANMAASFQRWWCSFISELHPSVRKPGREPVDIGRGTVPALAIGQVVEVD
jgi:hypothetical protein